MKRALSQRQAAILACIRESVAERGYPPTLREIGSVVDLSVASVKHHLGVLAERGYIRRDTSSPRAITVLDPPTLTTVEEITVPDETLAEQIARSRAAGCDHAMPCAPGTHKPGRELVEADADPVPLTPATAELRGRLGFPTAQEAVVVVWSDSPDFLADPRSPATALCTIASQAPIMGWVVAEVFVLRAVRSAEELDAIPLPYPEAAEQRANLRRQLTEPAEAALREAAEHGGRMLGAWYMLLGAYKLADVQKIAHVHTGPTSAQVRRDDAPGTGGYL